MNLKENPYRFHAFRELRFQRIEHLQERLLKVTAYSITLKHFTYLPIRVITYQPWDFLMLYPILQPPFEQCHKEMRKASLSKERVCYNQATLSCLNATRCPPWPQWLSPRCQAWPQWLSPCCHSSSCLSATASSTRLSGKLYLHSAILWWGVSCYFFFMRQNPVNVTLRFTVSVMHKWTN